MGLATDGTTRRTLGAAIVRFRTFRAGAAGAALDVFAIRIAAALFAYGAQVLMARVMGRTEYGIFASIWVWIAILGHSSTLGFAQGACRFLPADQARGDLAHVCGFLIGGAWVTGACACAVACLGLALVWMHGTLLNGPYAGPLLLAALVLPFFTLQDYLEGVARSQNWAVLAIAPPYLLRQGLIMAAMLGAVAIGAPAEAWVAVACTLAATGIALAVQAWIVILRLRAILSSEIPRYRWRAWLRACLPIGVADLAHSAFNMIDVVVLSMLMPPTAVGLYFVATRIQQFVPFVQYAASAATAQRFAAIHASGNGAGLKRFVRIQARLTLAATVTVGLIIVAAGPFLLAMFGPEFGGSVPLLAVLVAGHVGASLFGPGEDLLTMIDGERLGAAITLAMLAVAALLCVALVPAMGVMGAAIAMALATALRGAGMAVAAFLVHGIVTPVLPFSGRAHS
ncbi:lipopolysaccharide biosynthesis protein [Methylobacterium sp. E-045]|uniref:lipopolysaccharide biosynthesis protein n=1 Tax=Methylobacterium sp. E-045 TaxID=2836575 RepID=UPI001FB8EBA9|nr:lipopolysaccharide biosynthesis protein [Methylobacterium sp. E-045]MCJ2128381.1 lipopolysaccharide biosynthesis protein [Methylobacterium sp. E-045]